MAPGPDAAGRTPQASPRRRARAAIAVGVLLGAAGCGAYRALALNHAESTDKAYVQGNVVQITAQVPGTVVAILADDADRVKAGQALLRLDPADARVALDQAETQLAQTVPEVRTLYANNATYSAQITLREAELARTQRDVQRAQDDVNRRAPLLASGAVGQEEFAHSTTPAGHQPQRPGRCPIGLAGGARGAGVQPKPAYRRHRDVRRPPAERYRSPAPPSASVFSFCLTLSLIAPCLFSCPRPSQALVCTIGRWRPSSCTKCVWPGGPAGHAVGSALGATVTYPRPTAQSR